MKILAVGDLHGQKPEIHFKDFDAIIAPGDFCSDDSRKYMFEALRRRIKNPEDDVDWIDLVGRKKAKQIIMKSLKDGRKIMEFLNSFGKPVFVIPGNWDWTEDENDDWLFKQKNHYDELIFGLKNIIDLQHKKKVWKKLIFIGHGITSGPEYPQDKESLSMYDKEELLKKKRNYNEIKKKVSKLFKNSKEPIIYLSHNVPYNTQIDKIINKDSPKNGYHMGSLVSKEIIQKYHPLLCIGGHMHEHFGKCKIGKTVAINTGFGPSVNTLIEIEKGKIKKIEFWDGKKQYKIKN